MWLCWFVSQPAQPHSSTKHAECPVQPLSLSIVSFAPYSLICKHLHRVMLQPSDSFLNLQGILGYTPSSGVSGVISSEDTILVDLTFTVLLGKGSAHLSGLGTVLLWAFFPCLYLGYVIASRGLQLVRRAGDMEEETSTRGSMQYSLK